jgi:hypothetical protein
VSDSGTEGCALLSLFPLRPLTHVAVDPTLELRVVWVDLVVRVALFQALILLGRYRRMSSRADGRQAMMMPTVISTLDQVASQVKSSAGIRGVLVHVVQPHRTMLRIMPASDHLQVVEELAWECLLVGLCPLVIMTRHCRRKMLTIVKLFECKASVSKTFTPTRVKYRNTRR